MLGLKGLKIVNLCLVYSLCPIDRRKDVRVRLVDGSSPNQGRVEVYHQGAWGTVCHNAWDERDATVVCGMLGYPLGSSYCCSSYGCGSDTIWLDNVSCQGNESSIVDCKHSEWGINNCTHASDAGVYCYGPKPAQPSTVPAPTPTSTPSMSLVQLYCVILYHVMPCHAISCYVMLLCCVMLCSYVMLCYVMLCHVMLFYVLLPIRCYVLLCCVVLSYVQGILCIGFYIMLS